MAEDMGKERKQSKKLLYKQLAWVRAVKLGKGRRDREQSCLVRAYEKHNT